MQMVMTWSGLLQILRIQAAFSFAVLCIIMVFQNDFSLHRQSANLFMYAGDHQIYTNDSDIQKA